MAKTTRTTRKLYQFEVKFWSESKPTSITMEAARTFTSDYIFGLQTTGGISVLEVPIDSLISCIRKDKIKNEKCPPSRTNVRSIR